MLMGTVGVAPGTYTLQFGGIIHGGAPKLLGLGDAGPVDAYPAPEVASCVVDQNGPVHYGMPAWGWYDEPSAWYNQQFSSAATTAACSSCVMPPLPGGGTMPDGSAAMNPYGTQSQLKGFSDYATVFGVRLDILGLMIAGALGIGLALHHFAKR
jgi:hypothetical protein